MKSKWLEWKPRPSSVGFVGTPAEEIPIISCLPAIQGDKIIEKASPQAPTKPTKPSVREEPQRPDYFWGKHVDAYGWRLNIAFEAICEVPAPEGLIVWLDKHSSYLYRRLTSSLPDQISRAWAAQVPIEKFEALCFDLVDTYQRATELYRTAKQKT